MSEKSKTASTLAALAMAGVVAFSPGPATSQEAAPAAKQTTTQTATQQQELPIRYIDFSQRQDGWAAATAAATKFSANKYILIVAYGNKKEADELYWIAADYAKKPHNLPILGVIRAPEHPTEKSLNGFSIFYNGYPYGDIKNPDNYFANKDIMRRVLDNIKESYFVANVNTVNPIATTALAQNTTTGKSSGTFGGGTDSAGSGGGSGTGGKAGDTAGGKSGGKSGGGTEIAAVTFNPDI